MKVKCGCQVPNGSFSPADVVEVFGNGVYIIMQGELDKLQELRRLAPEAFIIIRFYLSNWYTTNPSIWASQCWQIWQQNRQYANAFTWANEQNLKSESGGVIGSSPGNMIKPGEYEKIRDWNISFLNKWDELEGHTNLSIKVFPALAMGNSDDQNDGAGIGLEILKPVIDRCQLGAIHPYWNSTLPLNDPWNGLGRIAKQIPFFGNKQIVVTETGNFAVAAEDAPTQYVSAHYYLQGWEQIFGFCYFVFADPTHSHQGNDMSRNIKIFDAIKSATKTQREELRIVPPVVTSKVALGLQIWQYNAINTIATLDDLKTAMDQVGATILSDKFADADTFQGQFDTDPLAVKSAAVMAARANWCRLNNKVYIPWHVPRAIPVNGSALEGAKVEGAFVGATCRQAALTTYVSDLEFYQDFFGYDLSFRGGTSWFADNGERNEAARAHYLAVKNANPDIKIILQPDPRQDKTGQIDILRLVSDKLIDGIIYQSYANFFLQQGDTRTHSQIIRDSIIKGQRLGIPWGICLYCEIGSTRDTNIDQAKDLFNAAIEAGASWIFLYKAPIATRLQTVIKRFAKEGSVIVVPDTDTIEKVQDEAWAVGEVLTKLALRANKLGYPWFDNGLGGMGDVVKSLVTKNKGEK